MSKLKSETRTQVCCQLVPLKIALAGVAQRTGRQPANQRAPGSGAWAWAAVRDPSGGRARGNHTLMSLPLFLPPFPSL